jgi:hypothetical protein
MSFGGMPSRHLGRAMCALVFSLGASAPALADSVSYQISFSAASGPTISNGSFRFDSLGQSNTVVGPPADFINLQAVVAGVPYAGTSPSDDSVMLNGGGLVSSMFADLEPADNPAGNILQLYAGEIYAYWNPTLTTRLGAGTYLDTAVVAEPSTLSLLCAGFLVIGAGLLFAVRPFGQPTQLVKTTARVGARGRPYPESF